MAEDAVHGWIVTALRFGDPIPAIDGFELGYLQDQGAGAEVSHVQA